MRQVAGWLIAVVLTGGSSVLAETSVMNQPAREMYRCPQCGKFHPRETGSGIGEVSIRSGGSIVPVASVVWEPGMGTGAVTSAQHQGGSASNVLDTLNAQRARQGVPSLRYDPQLQVVAERRAQQMAASGQKGHPPGSFAPGRYEGVGWSSSYSPSGVSACYTSDPRMQYAGAAMARGRDGVYFAVVYR